MCVSLLLCVYPVSRIVVVSASPLPSSPQRVWDEADEPEQKEESEQNKQQEEVSRCLWCVW